MRILVYSANYAPEPTGIGKYSAEMAQWLVDMGHEVRVVTAMPHYPAWRIDEAYRGQGYLRETLDGVEVHRAPLWVPHRPGALARMLYLIGFAATSAPLILRAAFWRPDVVLVVAPALVCAPAGWLCARLTGAAAWLHVQDFEIDVAFRTGMLRWRRRRRWIEAAERWLFRRFDRVSTISRRMIERTEAKGVAPSDVVFLPNWVDLDKIRPLAEASPFRAALGLAPDAVVGMYSGSLGAKHGLDLLPEVARRLAHLPNFVLVVCGEGVFQQQLAQAAASLPNMRTLPLQPADKLSHLLGMADVHLLPQSPGVSDLVMPSKLVGMFASGRPVVVAASPGTELAQVVQGHGAVVPPEDPTAFAAAVETLVLDAELRAQQGAEARRYAEANFGKDVVLHKLRDELIGLRSADATVTPASNG
ncbi:MAG TPA: WcaI family glycosyltransferase [Methylibium sp.]|uniref:WcaI family glycosyltransferase n=1 Tax=Methylibium sp. TaxID=2067992 RepID=UPI002DBFF903|nr:WcaI family glycosyltransferase [Methylibium sp.]HEU4458072.1 WcaI family glycosyltransferase [Methylibium sp.]